MAFAVQNSKEMGIGFECGKKTTVNFMGKWLDLECDG
jgi:hypothetical protein